MKEEEEVNKMARTSVRPPICADDRWYPASPEALRREVSDYIERAAALDLQGEVVGLVAPHAGYFFSGHVAGASYRQVQGNTYDTVVLIGPDHRGIAFGALAFADFDAWHTPLGDVPVDRELVSGLEARLSVRHIGRDSEHSLEVQLPFLQTALGEFKLVPILMGDPSPAASRELGLAVADAVRDQRALLPRDRIEGPGKQKQNRILPTVERRSGHLINDVARHGVKRRPATVVLRRHSADRFQIK